MMDEELEIKGSLKKNQEKEFMEGCEWKVIYRWKIKDDERQGF